MTLRLLIEHHLEFLSLKEDCTGSSGLSKYHIVGNLMYGKGEQNIQFYPGFHFLAHLSQRLMGELIVYQ